jgi:hypothetical protein
MASPLVVVYPYDEGEASPVTLGRTPPNPTSGTTGVAKVLISGLG